MATTTRILDANVNGTVYTANANDALEALDTCHSGATAPTDEVANGKLWLDTTTTPGILKIYNNATWEVVHSGTVDINGGTIDGATINGTVIGGATPAAVTTSSLVATTADINGGTIDGTVIGGATPAAVTGTTLTATGAFTSLGIDDNATATAVTIDASGAMYVGGTEFPTSVLGKGATRHIFQGAGDVYNVLWNTSAPAAGNKSRLYLGAKTGQGATWFGGSYIEGGLDNGTNSAGYLDLKTTDAGGTALTRMTLDSSGNVGIGTATPSGWGKSLSLSNTLNNSGITFEGAARKFGIGGGHTDGALRFFDFTAVAERMRIDSSGNVLVGTTTAGIVNGFSTSIEASGVNNSRININHTSGGSSNSSYFMQFGYGGTRTGGVTQASTTTVAYLTSSDYRLKDNITPIQGAGDIVKAMSPCTYTFKSDSTDWQDGFLAHELQEVLPIAVSGSKDAMKDEEYEVTPAVLDDEGNVVTEAVMGTRSVPDYQGVDYSKLTPILTAALQEALNKIDALEARVAALEL